MTYLFAFNIKINKKIHNKDLYEFCKYCEDVIVMITYEVKKKTYNIIVEIEDLEVKYDLKLKAFEIFKDLKYNKDYETQFIPSFVFKELEKNIYTCRISYNNPRMYLYFNRMVGKFKIEYISLFIFDTLNKFKISNMKEIICWHMLFFTCLNYNDYEKFNIWCVLRYWDDKYKNINIHKFNGICGKDKKIPKDVKKYINYKIYDKEINCFLNFEHDYPYINIIQIPNVFNITNFMENLEKEANDTNDYKNFINDNYEKMIKDIKEIKKKEKVEYDLYYELKVLFLTDKENSDIKNIIFNNEEEDEEYLEIVRTRRIKKSFMIN